MVRLATESDVRRISLSYARAFDTDPVWRWFIPFDGFSDRMAVVIDGLLRHVSLGYEATYTTDDGVCAAIWWPPGHSQTSEVQDKAMESALHDCFGSNLDKFQEGFGLVGTKHPHTPHWYLAGLATHPDWQGQGIASAVLRPMLERCDTEGLPAYLEATKEQNMTFYQHHGFELTGTVDLPGGGPSMYLMWREPQTR